jgi:hypothetical protein
MNPQIESVEKTDSETCKETDRQNKDRVYLIHTNSLRVSSTKPWAKSLDQLKRQIQAGCTMNGGLQDHFC